MCDPFHFEGITSAAFEQISIALADKGFALAGPVGKINGPYGIVLQYAWNEQDGGLSIEILEKSFFVSCNQIKEQLTSVLTRYASTNV